MDDAVEMDGYGLSDTELERVAGGLTEENKRILVGMVKDCKGHGMSIREAQRYMRQRISPATDKLFTDESMAFFTSIHNRV